MTEAERQINAFKKLGLSDAEIKEVLESDKKIDKGEKLFELSDDGKKIEKKMRQVEKKPTAYKFQQRERKEDNEKRFLITALVRGLTAENATDFNIINPERELEFLYNNKKYKIILSVPRK